VIGTALLLAASAGLTGCVAQQEYDDLRAANEAQDVRVSELQRELEAARSISERRHEANMALQAENSELQNMIANLRELISGLEEDTQARIQDLMARLSTVGGEMIDPETGARLEQLARENPGLFQYDAERGLVRVASDLTFRSGSADVEDTARSGLAQLARILAPALGDQYDIRVVGHTDSVRISNPETRRRFGTNRGLSTARAIAVSDVLQQNGIPADRIETSGWGPHRPVVANNPQGGTRENRRVDIYIVPTTEDEAIGQAAPEPERTPSNTGGSSSDFPVK
jgi:chemotaxis protein MotB